MKDAFLLARISILMILWGVAPSTQSADSSFIAVLSPDRVFPIEGQSKGCACAVFREGAQSPAASVVLSIQSADGVARARISGKDIDLRHVSHSSGSSGQNAAVTNVFASTSVKMTLRSSRVRFERACRVYPATPTEGSCFTGSLTVSEGERKETIPVTQICGC